MDRPSRGPRRPGTDPRLRLRLSFLALLALASAGAGHAATSPVGRWWTEDRGGVIEIAPCGAALCGRIVGLGSPHLPDGTAPRDSRGVPKCGLTILRDVVPDGDEWGGIITNPDDGTDWHCTLSVDDQGRLHLRGYVLVPLLGQTQIWPRFLGELTSDCTIVPRDRGTPAQPFR